MPCRWRSSGPKSLMEREITRGVGYSETASKWSHVSLSNSIFYPVRMNGSQNEESNLEVPYLGIPSELESSNVVCGCLWGCRWTSKWSHVSLSNSIFYPIRMNGSRNEESELEVPFVGVPNELESSNVLCGCLWGCLWASKWSHVSVSNSTFYPIRMNGSQNEESFLEVPFVGVPNELESSNVLCGCLWGCWWASNWYQVCTNNFQFWSHKNEWQSECCLRKLECGIQIGIAVCGNSQSATYIKVGGWT